MSCIQNGTYGVMIATPLVSSDIRGDHHQTSREEATGEPLDCRCISEEETLLRAYFYRRLLRSKLSAWLQNVQLQKFESAQSYADLINSQNSGNQNGTENAIPSQNVSKYDTKFTLKPKMVKEVVQQIEKVVKLNTFRILSAAKRDTAKRDNGIVTRGMQTMGSSSLLLHTGSQPILLDTQNEWTIWMRWSNEGEGDGRQCNVAMLYCGLVVRKGSTRYAQFMSYLAVDPQPMAG